MKDDEFFREMNYQIIMYYARRLVSGGIITEDEYRGLNTDFLRKYKPVIGSLLHGE